MGMNSFHYCKGPCETSVPWLAPDPINLNNWKEDLYSEIDDFGTYKLWLMGGAIESRPSWDVDIQISGPLSDKGLLEKIMIAATNLGFKHRTLIDCLWTDLPEEYLSMGDRCKGMQIACEETVRTGHCTGANCDKNVTNVTNTMVTICREIYKNGREISCYRKAKKIHDNLWVTENVPHPGQYHKCIKRYRKHKINLTYPILINRDIDFKNYLSWP